ncbi:rod shape-determining protein MreC [Skermanella sp. TT6]|uniref:Cell shape-determining protein MreC n=1 Tax=Skermanella cutis TaxID=2775420 RepID=A0ABX7B7T7_9PROT|nr:rod shape-determining protein MreC [Skermanella sp. TT6]QQP90397.1 rod shape-determining protein MreC [Skermanella sp. TT6]
MKTRATGSVVRLAAPLRALAQRFSFLLLVFAAIALMMVGKVDTVLVDGLRVRVTDAFAPILDAISRPAATAAHFVESLHEIVNLRGENERLRQENAALLQWQQAAQRLDAENRSLRSLLNYKPELAASYITARVVADPGGAFVRTVVVTAGRRDGVRPGQAAVSGRGLMGRVVQAGEWSSRVLLITDLNSRIPVVIEPSRQRAVMGGDNSGTPRLLYLPGDTAPAVGDRVVTSGHGGMFPPGLPVGLVAEVGESAIRVQPFVDPGRVEHVQLVNFGLSGGLGANAPADAAGGLN